MNTVKKTIITILAGIGLFGMCLGTGRANTAEWMRLNVELINGTELIERLWFVDDPVVMNDVLCLASNVYHEARGSSIQDQYGVAHVVMNRVAHRNWAKNPCQVIWEPYQFSWTNDNNSDMPTDKVAWRRAQEIAWDVYSSQAIDLTGGADHYHTEAVKPAWSRNIRSKKKIGAHLYMTLN